MNRNISIGIMAFAIAMQFCSVSEANAAWWNSSWTYARHIPITDASNGIILLELNSSTFNFSNSLPGGDDLRFIDNDNSTLKNYYVAKVPGWNVNDKAYVYVRIDSGDTGGIWMYYGNKTVSSGIPAEDPNSVFSGTGEYFTDFENYTASPTSINGQQGWTTGGEGSGDVCEITTVSPINGTKSYRAYEGNNGCYAYRTIGNYTIYMEADVVHVAGGSGHTMMYGTDSSIRSLGCILMFDSSPDQFQYNVNSPTNHNPVLDFVNGKAYQIGLLLRPGPKTYDTIVNFTLRKTGASVDNPSFGGALGLMLIQAGSGPAYNQMYFDNIRIRQWIASTYTINSEETEPAGADTTPPEITIVSPLNTTYASTLNLNITLNENGNACLYNLDSGSNASLSGATTNWYTEVTPGSDGTHQLFAYCNDTAGNMALNSSIWFTYDTTPPFINISLPLNTSYITSSIPVNVSANETISAWWYQLNSNGTNNTFTPNITITGSEGQNNLTVWANDTAGNLNSSSVWFLVDTIPPAFIWISANSTLADNVTSISWRYNVSEHIGTFCYFEINGTNRTGAIYDDTYPPGTAMSYCLYQETGIITNQTHCAVAHADDTAGNVNSSSDSICITTSIIYEHVAITIDNPASGQYGYPNHDLNVTTDVPADTCQYMIGPLDSNHTLLGSADNWSAQISVPPGTHTLWVYCQNGSLWNQTSISIIYASGSAPPGPSGGDAGPEPNGTVEEIIDTINDLSEGNKLSLYNQIDVELPNGWLFSFNFALIPLSILLTIAYSIYREYDQRFNPDSLTKSLFWTGTLSAIAFISMIYMWYPLTEMVSAINLLSSGNLSGLSMPIHITPGFTLQFFIFPLILAVFLSYPLYKEIKQRDILPKRRK